VRLTLFVALVPSAIFSDVDIASLLPTGAQFLLAVKVFDISSKCLPLSKRPKSLSYSSVQWALQSDSQDSLAPLTISQAPLWSELRALGVPMWMKSDEALRVLVERVAKAEVRGRTRFLACLHRSLCSPPSLLS
jgi:hypothetical protein